MQEGKITAMPSDIVQEYVVPPGVTAVRIEATAVQRCRIGWTESSMQQLQAEAKWLIGEGFPNRRMSDSWGGNRLGICRDCICAADGLAGRRS